MLRRLLVLTIAALLALALAGPPAMPRPAQAAGPGMTLAAPANVAVGETFTVSINADPAPDVEIGAFASELLFPGELTWVPRPNCEGPGPEAAVQVSRQDGEPVALCIIFQTPVLSPAQDGIAYAVGSGSGGLPLPALDVAPGSTTTLVESDLRCDAPGAYDLVLTATPDRPAGALYGDLSANEVWVKTQPFDVDGDTTPENVADVLTVDCGCPSEPCPTPAPLLPPLLRVDSECSPDTIRPNEDALIVCKTTVTNSGGSTAAGLIIGGTIPSDLGVSSFHRFSLVVNGQRKPITFSGAGQPLPPLPAGQVLEIESRVVVRAESEGSYEANLNSVHIANGGWSASDTISFDVAADAASPPTNLAISKTLLTEIEPSPVQSTLEYELVATNIGAVAMSSVTISSKNGESVQITATDPLATIVDEVNSLVVWELGPLAPGEAVRVRVTIGSNTCGSTESVMVVTAQPEVGVEEHYATVDRQPVRLPTSCPQPEPPGGTTIDEDSTGGASSEVAGLAFGGDSTDMGALFTGGSVGAPTTGAGPRSVDRQPTAVGGGCARDGRRGGVGRRSAADAPARALAHSDRSSRSVRGSSGSRSPASRPASPRSRRNPSAAAA